MDRKLLFSIIILTALLALYFVYNYFTLPVVKTPTNLGIQQNFKGPSGPPYVKGPTGPPPTY